VAARPRRLDELGGEALDPPVDGHVIDGDTALGHQLLDIAVGQAIAQVPTDRDRDHLAREPETSKHRGRTRRHHHTSLLPAAIDQRNSALLTDGVTRLIDWYGYDWPAIFSVLTSEGPSGLIARVRSAEWTSPPSYGKPHDDATAVHVRQI